MNDTTAVFAILPDEEQRAIANQIAMFLGYTQCHIVVGDGFSAARFLETNNLHPRFIYFDIGDRAHDVLGEIDALSQHCVEGTQLIVAGAINDIQFYRQLIQLGAVEYFTHPVKAEAIAASFNAGASADQTKRQSKIVSFISGASGDGASTVAVNVAYAAAKNFHHRTVIVDMDYQFGMLAKNLDLSTPHTMKELLAHPDRGVDTTLIQRIAKNYGNVMDVITAPNQLEFIPAVQSDIIRQFIAALRNLYDVVILDLPNSWSPWIVAALSNSDHVMMISQLSLKSAAHSMRKISALSEAGMDLERLLIAINRSGSKFREGVSTRDFEHVCHKQVSILLPNDTRTMVDAEQYGQTVMELKRNKFSAQIEQLARLLVTAKNRD